MYENKTLRSHFTDSLMIAICVVLLIGLGISQVSAETGMIPPTIKMITPQAGYNTTSVKITNLAGAGFWGSATTASLFPAGYPIQPVLSGSLVDGTGGAMLDGANSVFVRGSKAYIASTNDDALEIVDVAIPATPTHVAGIANGTGGALLDGASGVYVFGNYAYVASRDSDALEIINIATPASPVHAASVRNGAGGYLNLNGPKGVFVTNGSSDMRTRAYVVSTESKSLQIVDVTNPASPVRNGNISDNDAARGNMSAPGGIYVSGNYAYITSQSGLEIVDISAFWTPKHAGYLGNGIGGALLNNPSGIQVAGKYAYIASYGSNALEIVNVTDPRNPKHMGSLAHGSGGAQLSGPTSVYVSGIYAYVASRNGNTVEVIDISNPAAPVHKGSLNFGTGYGSNGIFVAGNYVYVANNLHKSLETVTVNTGAVPATGLNVVSSSKINCTFAITNRPAGLYSVVVTNPDLQQAVLLNGFRILPAPPALTEPFPGWKFHGVLSNTGLYNDGGYRPDGKELWNVSDASQPSAEISMVESTPAVVNGIVYVGDREGHLYAINARTGAIKWRNTLDYVVYRSSPAVANGMVYIGTGNYRSSPAAFYAFDAGTGGSNIPVWKKNLPGGVDSSPVVYNGTVYVGRMDGNVSAWNATTGAEVWRYKTSGDVSESLAISNGSIYFVTDDTNLFSLNAVTGEKIWDAKNATGWDGSVTLVSGPAVAYGKVFVGGSSRFYSFDEMTGDLLYRISVPPAYIYGCPAVADGIVYFGTSGDTNAFYALNANDLSERWVNHTPDNTRMVASPAVANGIVYVTSDRSNIDTKGFLYAWNAKTGAPIWNFHKTTLSGTYSSPAVANGVVYFGTWWSGFFAVGTENTASVTDIGVFRSGQWILDYGMDGTVNRRLNYGQANDQPIVGDFNNDGTADIGVFRSGQWILDYGMDGTVNRRFNYGLATDKAVAGDFNKDGMADIGVFRSGQWILDYSMDGTVNRRLNYGQANDQPVIGDFNNDGTADIGVFRSGQWILDYGMDGTVNRRLNYGLATDTPLAGDFNNDGTADIGVFRSGQWILDYSMDGTVNRRFNYGLATDIPIVGKLV